MTFFYDLNKKIAALAGKQELTEGKESVAEMDMAHADIYMEKATGDYSAKKARAGKDIGKPGKAFGKIAKDAAERYGSKERGEKVAGAVLAKLRSKTNEADMEEGNEFSGELAKAKASGAKEFNVDGKTYQVKEAAKPDYIDLDKDGNKKESMKKAAKDKKKNAFDPDVARSMFSPEKGKTKTGHDVKDTGYSKRYTKKLDDEPEDSDDDTPKTKGRKAVGAGKGKKIGAKVRGTSKLHSKGAIAEEGDGISLLDKGEYDREGDMAKDDLQSIAMAAKELHGILGDDQNLPEWVQSKITKALDYINASNQYMHQQEHDVEPVAEKAVSKKQQKFMGMVHAAQKGEKPASAEVAKVAKEMPKKAAKDFAATKHKGLPEKVKEEGADAPKSKKGGIQFGKGVYEAMNDNLEKVISESMNVNVSMSTNDAGEPTKSITVSAEGEQAEMLAQLLNLAGLQSGQACSTCGSTPCGCEQQVDEVDENQPDWPTDTETTGNDDPQLKRWAGGLNKPKETGQTTAPVVNRDPARGSVGPKEMAENVDLGLNLYAELKSFKAK